MCGGPKPVSRPEQEPKVAPVQRPENVTTQNATQRRPVGDGTDGTLGGGQVTMLGQTKRM